MLKRAAISLRAVRPRFPLRHFASLGGSSLTRSATHIKAAKIDYPFDPSIAQPRGSERISHSDLQVGSRVGDFTVEAIHDLDLYKIKIYDLKHENSNTRYIHLDSADL